jgi:hypothetical protein
MDIRLPQMRGHLAVLPLKKHIPTDKLLFLKEHQARAVLSYEELIPAIQKTL